MKVLHTKDGIRTVLDATRPEHTVGFVPTMGALHEGHLSLIRRARAECDVVVVSIFVNPAQFGPREDLEAYPRTLEADLAGCAREGVDLVFAPTAEEMYPEPVATTVRVDGLSEPMEGRFRPGHMEGVALVCTKLFAIVGRCRAYFGEKDAQQLRVVGRLAADLDLGVEVVGCPTVREADGLALSSRNAYLSPEERRRALVLYRCLDEVARRAAAGERDTGALLHTAREVLGAEPPDAVDYVEIVDPDTLDQLDRLDGRALVCGAIRIGDTRLIDNMLVDSEAVTADVPATTTGEGRR